MQRETVGVYRYVSTDDVHLACEVLMDPGLRVMRYCTLEARNLGFADYICTSQLTVGTESPD